MQIVVVSADRLFITAVQGLAGAMGHTVRVSALLADVPAYDLLIVDGALEGALLGVGGEPPTAMRTAIFAPEILLAAAHATGVAHIHLRSSLAHHLPRLLSEYASAEPR